MEEMPRARLGKLHASSTASADAPAPVSTSSCSPSPKLYESHPFGCLRRPHDIAMINEATGRGERFTLQLLSLPQRWGWDRKLPPSDRKVDSTGNQAHP